MLTGTGERASMGKKPYDLFPLLILFTEALLTWRATVARFGLAYFFLRSPSSVTFDKERTPAGATAEQAMTASHEWLRDRTVYRSTYRGRPAPRVLGAPFDPSRAADAMASPPAFRLAHC